MSENLKKIVGSYSFFVANKIGEGFSSEVFRGSHNKTNEEVAIKVITKIQSKKDANLQMTQVEVRCLEKLINCPHILQIKNVFQTKNNMYVVTQFCEGGTLYNFIKRRQGLPESEAVQLIKQIILGYIGIAKNGIIHRDLKSQNILIKGCEVKICDFGFAIDSSQGGRSLSENAGSPIYMPLQTLTSNIYSFKSDIWALGVIFYEMIFGKEPWKSRRLQDLEEELKKFQPKNLNFRNLKPKSKQFLMKTLQANLQARMDLIDLQQFQFEQFCEEVKQKFQNKVKNINSLKQTGSQKEIVEGSAVQSAKHIKSTQMLKNEWDLKKQEINQKTARTKQTISSDFSENVEEMELIKVKSVKLKLRQMQSLSPESKNLKETMLVYETNRLHQKISKDNKEHDQQNLQKKGRIRDYQSQKEKQILLQIKAQINYFRFLFKILKKMRTYLKQKSEALEKFQRYLLHLIFQKISEIKALKNVKGVSKTEKQDFMKTSYYQNIETVLKNYEQRYRVEMGQKSICIFNSEKEFLNLFSNINDSLHDFIHKYEAHEDQINRKKNYVLILDSLIKFYHIYWLHKEEDWKKFLSESNISELADGEWPEKIDLKYWRKVKDEYAKLKKE